MELAIVLALLILVAGALAFNRRIQKRARNARRMARSLRIWLESKADQIVGFED